MEAKARWPYSLSHFHAQYGEYRISVDIVSGVADGRFPRPALNAVLEWYGFTDTIFWRIEVWENGADLSPGHLPERMARRAFRQTS